MKKTMKGVDTCYFQYCGVVGWLNEKKETWLNRLTDLREEGVGGEDWKRFAKEHICVASGHRQCGAFGGGAGAGWSGVKGKVR